MGTETQEPREVRTSIRTWKELLGHQETQKDSEKTIQWQRQRFEAQSPTAQRDTGDQTKQKHRQNQVNGHVHAAEDGKRDINTATRMEDERDRRSGGNSLSGRDIERQQEDDPVAKTKERGGVTSNRTRSRRQTTAETVTRASQWTSIR